MQDLPAEGTEKLEAKASGLNRPAGIRIVRSITVAIANTSLFLMMLLVASDVAGRYLFNSPILGGYELIEYFMACLVPFSVAYCAAKKDHIGVDILVEKLSRSRRRRVEAVTLFFSTILAGILSWQTILAIPDSYASGLKSAVLHIPAYPAVIAVAVGAFGLLVFTLIHFIETLKDWSSK